MSWLTDFALKSTVILSIAWLGGALLRRRSAASRHLWWCGAVASLAALPLFMALLPDLRVPVAAPALVDALATFRADAAMPAAAGGSAAGPVAVPARQALARNWSWREIALAVWLLGTVGSLLRLTIAHFALVRLRRRARLLDDAAWRALLVDAAAQLGVRRSVRLLRGSKGGVPMTAGWLRPVIYLPAEAETWDEERRRVVLTHELAHICRHDALTGALTRLALCGYWFHPLAWLAAREFLKDRERAADDLVLASGATPSGYARHLLEIACVFRAPAAASAAAVCMARPSQLEGRLVAILDAKLPRNGARPALAALVLTAALLATAPVAAVRAQSGSAPPTAAEMDSLIRKALAARDHATLESLAGELVRQRKYAEANQIGSAALEMRGQRFGNQSKEYAEGLVAQGNLLAKEGKWDEAEQAYAQAAALQSAAGAPDPATTGFLAMNQYRQKHYAQAIELYQRALALQPPPSLQVRLLAGLGTAESDAGRDLEAETHFRAALNAAAGDDSIDSATAIELYARFLRAHNRGDEASSIQSRAIAIRKAAIAAGNTPVPEGGEPLKVGNGVESPRLTHKVEPQYTAIARAAGHTGSVRMTVTIGSDGKVHTIDLAQGIGLGLDEQAADAIRQWTFEPAKLNGTPVAVKATIEVNFRLM